MAYKIERLCAHNCVHTHNTRSLGWGGGVCQCLNGPSEFLDPPQNLAEAVELKQVCELFAYNCNCRPNFHPREARLVDMLCLAQPMRNALAVLFCPCFVLSLKVAKRPPLYRHRGRPVGQRRRNRHVAERMQVCGHLNPARF